MGGYSSTDPLRPPRPRELPDTQRSNPRVLQPAPTKPRQAMKIAILDDYQNVALSIADWSAVAKKAEITVFNDHIDQTDALIERLLPFDVICVMRERTPLRRDIIERLPRLRFIASTGSRNISIDMAAAKERGIIVANTGDRSTPTIELTWALILASARHLVGESNSIRAGGWQISMGSEVDGRVLGVLGLGNVGREVARIGRAFAHETDSALGQHVARSDRRRASAHRGLARTGHRGSGGRRFRYRALAGEAPVPIPREPVGDAAYRIRRQRPLPDFLRRRGSDDRGL